MRFSSSVPYFVFLEKTTGAESSTYSFMCVGDVCTGDYEASNPRKKMREKLREITHNQLFSLSEKNYPKGNNHLQLLCKSNTPRTKGEWCLCRQCYFYGTRLTCYIFAFFFIMLIEYDLFIACTSIPLVVGLPIIGLSLFWNFLAELN